MAKEYIEREAAYQTLTEYYHHTTEGMHSALREAISRVPAADVRPVVRGKWVYQGNENFPYCSECMMPQDMPTDFCPSCGADMREGLTMHEELVKRLRCQRFGNCPNCAMRYTEEVEPNLWRERCAAIDAADAIEELTGFVQEAERDRDEYRERLDKANDAIEELSKPRWIPVTERLPKKSGVYLGWMQWDLTDPDDNPSAYPIEYDAEEEAFGWWKPYYDPDSLGRTGEEFIRYESATHWMPLPEPPKEET